MSNLALIFQNRLLVSAGLGWILAQIVKTIIYTIINRTFSIERLVGSGGMPSCHSATVCSLSTSAFILCGPLSSEFAISAILAIIVMYDARGVRMETSNQAVILNQIMAYFTEEHPGTIEFTKDNLKELIGHTPLQVAMGGILGIIIGYFYSTAVF